MSLVALGIRFVVWLSALAGVAAWADAVQKTFVLQYVRVVIDDNQVIGNRKAGLGCLPAGKLRWSDFAQNSDRNVTSVTASLAQAGILAMAANTVMDETEESPRYRVSAEIMALSADICRPHYNWLKLGSIGLKGSGTITVRWRVRDVQQQKTILDKTIAADFKVETPGKALDAVIQAGLYASTNQMAPEFIDLAR